MNIVYYGACWPTNIGNAFIDYGSIYTIKTAAPGAGVFFASELPRWLFSVNKADMDGSIDLAELMDVDCLVVSGMTLCDEFIAVEGPVLRRLAEKGVKIIFSGCGGLEYTAKEVYNFKRFLETLKVTGFISRDRVSFDNYKDSVPRSFDGIDCAFFLSDGFKPAPFRTRDFVVYNFDSSVEPQIEDHGKRIIRTNHSCRGFIKARKLEFMRRPRPNGLRRDFLSSDIPEDYLNLYANTHAVYSDRVHACIATLSFGNFARLYSKTPRAYLFESVGAGEIKDRPVKLDKQKFQDKKTRQLKFLTELLAGK